MGLFEDCIGCYEHVDTARLFKDHEGAGRDIRIQAIDESAQQTLANGGRVEDGHPGWVCDGCGKHVTGTMPVDQCSDCGGRWFEATPERLACDRCAGCADEFDTRVDDGPTEARYRNPPQYYDVEAAPGMEDADPDA